jgi:predicted CoA-binding protein
MAEEKNTTLVLGASENPDRYSNRAVLSLRKHGKSVAAVGLRMGRVGDVEITNEKKLFGDIDTVTIYLSKKNQVPYYDYILSLNPRRIIFNPGAENDELAALAVKKGIECEEACTLVLLATKQY